MARKLQFLHYIIQQLASYVCTYDIQCYAGLPYQEIVELAYQLKIDMQKRKGEMVELDNALKKVKELEKDKKKKVGQHMTIRIAYTVANAYCKQ